MKISSISLFLGLFIGIALGVIGSHVFRRVISWHSPSVVMWTREEAKQQGAWSFRTEYEDILQRDIGFVIDQCQSDYNRMARGESRLLSMYKSKSGSMMIVLFDCYRDQCGRDVSDRVLAYVYDAEHRKLIGKFWVPMS